MRFALALILAAAPELSVPRLTPCVARAFALEAWDLSGIGNLRLPGRPNLLVGSALRVAAFSFAILNSMQIVSAVPPSVSASVVLVP
jgi:hypothetical protein